MRLMCMLLMLSGMVFGQQGQLQIFHMAGREWRLITDASSGQLCSATNYQWDDVECFTWDKDHTYDDESTKYKDLGDFINKHCHVDTLAELNHYSFNGIPSPGSDTVVIHSKIKCALDHAPKQKVDHD